MNTAELIAAVRMGAFIDDGGTYPDYDDPRLRIELQDCMRAMFERAIAGARSGYWQKYATVQTTPGRAKYRIPHRAVTGGLENVCVADAGGGFVKLEELSETHALWYQSTGSVVKYVVRGDQVVLLGPPTGGLTLRMTYYLKPSQFVEPQQPDSGRITAVDPVARTITVAQDWLPTPTVGSALDVIHPNGWHELALVSGPVTNVTGAGLIYTIGGTDPLDEIEVGDYALPAGETVWPALPEEFHRTLADLTAAKIMQQLNWPDKAGVLLETAMADFQRFTDMLVPRVKADARALRAPSSVLQAGRSARGFYGWRG